MIRELPVALVLALARLETGEQLLQYHGMFPQRKGLEPGDIRHIDTGARVSGHDEDERPRPGWREILHLAERLAPEPRLIPADPWDRVLLFGLGGELMDEDGLAWCRRLMMFDAMQRPGEEPAGFAKLRGRDYGYTPEDAARAPARVVQILETFAEHWRRQRERGSRYLLGSELSALDLYWATMAAMVAPLPHGKCPMPEGLRSSYEGSPEAVRAAVDPALLEHRDFIYENWLTLPVDT